jgi:iron complex outermembrane recepter protein
MTYGGKLASTCAVVMAFAFGATVARAQGAAAIVPPEPRVRVDAVYPGSAERREADVVLEVVVGTDGRVAAVSVATSGGKPFDDAAVAAAHQWTFVPARSDDLPVRAKIRLGFHFDPPPATASSPTSPSTTPIAGAQAAAVSSTATVPAADESEEVVVRRRSYIPSRGAGDYEIAVGKLALVPRTDAAGLLRLAPGVFLTNVGGMGHPYQVFLRGFDAREGQDIEFTVDGVPVNEVGNVHGNGLVDTNFIIPELVQNLRVIEGPFAPQQGNFAVAGSALYDVGLQEPGLAVKGTYGSFGTRRLLLTWKPRGTSDHTFGGAEVVSAEGFGENRKNQHATAMAGYEGTLGKRGLWRALVTSYAAHYSHAGVLRDDDIRAGRKDFFSTYDTGQGGDSTRHSASFVVEDKIGETSLSQSAFLVLRDFRLRQNLTGFQQDPQRTWQTSHAQRGDLIDQQSNAMTFGGRGSARMHAAFLGQRQELELGYFGRYDDIRGLQQRNRTGTNIPYRKDLELDSALANLGVLADASLKPFVSWITLRGGARVDYYSYRVHDLCALKAQATQAAVGADTECFSADRAGYRSTDQTASTSAGIVQPRATLLLGPFRGFTLSASRGTGSRSIDPQYINQDLQTPFAEVTASEGGMSYVRAIGNVDLLVKSVFFQTSVDKDLFFNQSEGRNTLANGTTRTGWAGNVRATGAFFDLAASATLVRATFDDTRLLIPYAPNVVLRGDMALFGDLPFRIDRKKLRASLGAGVSFVGKRPLPLGEASNTIFTTDLAANVHYRAVQIGLICTNLFDRRYRVAEYNYASDFQSRDYPTLVASRHFAAGEPRAIYATFTLTFGGDEN